MVASAARIPAHITQTSVAEFLAEHLELRDGLYLWRRGFDPIEVKNSVQLRWGKNSWERIRKQAWRIASTSQAAPVEILAVVASAQEALSA